MEKLNIITLLRTLLSYLLLLIAILIFFVPAIILMAIFPENKLCENRLLFWLLDKLFKSTLFASLLPIDIQGKENISKQPSIIAANHESALDIPVVGSLLNGYPQLWFALEFYAKKPVLGFVIHKIGIAVDRENPPKAARSLIMMLRKAESFKGHIVIFPEGARHIDGKVHPFLQGFAMLANKTKRPVVPVYMPNNGAIYPPGSFLIHWYPIKVVIGKPFEFQDNETEEQFTERVQAWFTEQNTEHYAK